MNDPEPKNGLARKWVSNYLGTNGNGEKKKKQEKASEPFNPLDVAKYAVSDALGKFDAPERKEYSSLGEIGDSGFDNFREGLQQGKQMLTTGFGYTVGEVLDRVGADELGQKVKAGAQQEARKVYDPDDSWGQFFGSLIPSVAPTAGAIAAAPFTGGGSILGAASIGALSTSSAGNGMMEYEAYKKSKGQEVDENAKLAVGVAYGVAEGLFERFQLGKLMPNVGKNLLKGNVKAAEKAGKNVIEAYKKANPQKYSALMNKVKQGLTTEGLEEVGTEIAQAGTQLLYQEREDQKETLQNLPKQLGMAMLGGSIMGAGLGPLSYGSQNLSNQKRRRANGGVTLVQSKEDGQAYEILGINPGGKDQPPTYSALDKNGNPVVLAEEEIGEMANLTVDQFDKLLQDKLDTQEVNLFNMEPKTLATYGEQQVEVVGEAEKDGRVYITLPDGSQKSVFEEELEDITMVSPEEQYIAEGNEIIDQPKEPVEAIRDKQQVIETADGDFLYPDDPGYEEASQAQQQQAEKVQQKAENTRGVTFGKGNKAKRANLVPADDGSYDVLTFTEVGENAEPVERSITELTETEIDDYAKQLNKVLDGKGMQVLVEPTDSDDPLSPSQIRVYKKDSQQVQQKRLDEYAIKADGAKVSVVNTKTGNKVGPQSKFYLPKVKQYFSENAPGYSRMERVGDDPRVTEQNYLNEVASRSDNPVEIAEAYEVALQNAESSDRGSTKEMAIAQALKTNPNLSRKQLKGRGLDEVYKGIAYANYAADPSAPSSETMGLDELSEILTSQTGQTVTEDDIMDFIQDNPGGPSGVLNQKDKDVENLEDAFREVTGAEISPALAKSITGANVQATSQQTEKDSALESEFENVADEDLPNTGAQNFTAEIADLEQQLRDEGVTDEEIEAIKQEADELSREEIEALESQVEAEEGPTGKFIGKAQFIGNDGKLVNLSQDPEKKMVNVYDHGDGTGEVWFDTESKWMPVAINHLNSMIEPTFNIDSHDKNSLEVYNLEPAQIKKEGNDWVLTRKGAVTIGEPSGLAIEDTQTNQTEATNESETEATPVEEQAEEVPGESEVAEGGAENIEESTGQSGSTNTVDVEVASDEGEGTGVGSSIEPSPDSVLDAREQSIKDELSDLFDEFDDLSRGQANIGIDPKMITISGKIIAKGAELGYVKIQQFADWVINNKGADFWRRIFPNFKAAYSANLSMEGNPNNEDLNAIAKSTAEDYIAETTPENISDETESTASDAQSTESTTETTEDVGSDEKEAWQLTREDVLGENPKVDDFAANWNEEAFVTAPAQPVDITDPIHTGRERRLGTVDGSIDVRYQYAVANDTEQEGRILLMQRNVDPQTNQPMNDWSPVGEYIGGNLGIIAAYRGDGAGTAFEKYLIENNLRGPSIGYSPGGIATIENAHKQIIREAIERGENVPEDVLSSYPDLQESQDNTIVSQDNSVSDEREYSSTQVNIEGETAQQAIEFAESIPENELYNEEGFGAETEPHVTALFGLTADNADQVRDLLQGFGPVELTMGETSLFENENYDVLKVDIDSPDLVRLNQLLRDNVEFENDFPDYQPHMTIAYLKPGEGAKYAGDTRFEGQTVTLDELLFSGKDRTKTPISLISEELRESGQETSGQNMSNQGDTGQPTLFDNQPDNRVRRTKLPEPKDGWREGLLKARKYAIELGIKPTKEDGSSKSLNELVNEVDAYLSEETTEPSTPKARAEISHGLKQDGQTAFEQLSTFIDLKNLPDGYHQKYGEKGDAIMPLTIEKQPMFVRTKDTLVDPDAYYLIVEQWGIQNGDIMSDPRVDFLVYPNLGLAFPFSFTNSYAGVYQEFVKNGFLSHEMAGTVDFLEDSWVPHITGSGLLDRPSGQQETEIETNELTGEEQLFVSAIGKELEAGNQLNKRQLEDLAQRMGVVEGDKRIKELAEYAIILRARELADTTNNDILPGDLGSTESTYQAMVELYENQPNLTARTSTSIRNQQYSTPAPIAYLMGVYTNLHNGVAGFEPSAGNGLLTIAAGKNPSNVRVNEIDGDRLEMLRLQSFYDITEQDGTEVFPFDKSQQAIVTNPPFGATDARYQAEVMGRDIELSKLEHVMAARALDSMRDDGKASILIGGNDSFNDKGNRTGQDRSFFHFLHHYYNVDQVLNFGGNVFNKQGANFPTRVILINGRKDTPKGHAPMNTEGVNVITDLTTLYQEVAPYLTEANNEPILQSELDAGRPTSEPVSDTGSEERGDNESGATATVPGGRSNQNDQPGGESTGTNSGDTRALTDSGGRDGSAATNVDPDGQRRDGNEASGTQTDGQTQRTESEGNNEGRTPRDIPREKSKLDHRLSADDIINNEGGNVVYSPLSDSESITTEMPASMAFSMVKSLNALADEVGNVDAYVMEKVGFESVDQLYEALAGEQVDAVALAIYQAERGKSVVVGDQTGIGKGRVAATMIRYAKQRGIIPVFWTEKPKLFSDIHRDLKDIGVNYRPFIVNARDKGFIVDEDGRVVYRAGKRSAQNRVFKNPELVSDFDYVALTYSQIQSTSATTKRDFIRSLAPNALIIMDESHNASGQSNTGEYLMEVLNESQGAVYLSATFAKRPDNMPVYAIKTDISDVAMNQDEMVEAIERGGVALQEIISSDLVKSGQMVRRQRSFKGVKRSFEVMGVDDKGKPDALGQQQRKLYDDVSEIMRNIIDFQVTHVTPVLNDMADDLNDYGITEGTDKAGVDNQPFVSRIHHIVDMLLFSVKADAVADRAIEVAQSGRKPIIAIKSTMESVLDDVIATGETVDDLHFGLVLTRALDSVMKYRVTDGISGDKDYNQLSVSELTPTGQKAYERITQKALDITAELKGSPIDYIVNKIEEAGFSIGEVTGRSRKVVYDENGRAKAVNRKKEETDKNILFNGFNSGELDMLLINSSGATGASAHSSEKFQDQRQRVMIIHQPELNINTEVQKWGRIFRTGQVNLPEYQYITSAIPAELRLMMVLKKKIKSLDANTTSSQKTSSDFMDTSDFINKYGDEIVTGWFKENQDMQQKLQQPIKKDDWSKVKDGSLTRVENLAMKVTGRMAFMPSDVQEAFYEEISQSYDNYIDALNEMGENELVMDNVDLQAETLDKKVIVKGKKPGTPFGGHTYLEKVKAKTLRKPLKSDEIEAQVKNELDGQEPQQYRDDIFAKAKRFYQNREADQIKAVRESDRDADEKKERIAEIESYTADEIKRLEKKSLFFIPGQVYVVPADAKGESGVTTNGVFLGYGINGSAANPYSASAIKIRFAVNSSQRTMTVPTSFNGFINAIKADTQHLSTYAKNAILKDWDSNLDTSGFETRHIITGNVLQGLSKSGNKGQLIQYTTNEGSVKNGVLLSANIKKEELDSMDSVRIEAKEVEPLVFNLGNGEKLDMSANTGIRRTWGGEYELFVPSSKVRGSRYYLDETLLDMVVDNNFVKKGNEMRATVPIQNMGRVLEYLSNEHSIYADVSRNDLERVTEGDGPMFKRADSASTSANTEQIATHLENLVSDWKSKDRITVARSFEELPYIVQQYIIKEGGGISGTYLDGKVYINAYEHSNIESAERTLLHETVGHLGFRGLLENMAANREQYNQLYTDLTHSIYDAFKGDAEFQRIANKYEFDFRYNRDRSEAAEEFLAHMAERGDQAKSFVDKFVQLIKDALASLGFRTKLTRADLIDLVTDMRRFVDSDFSVYNDGHIMRAAFKRDYSKPFFSELEQTLQSKLSGRGTAKSYREQIEGFERKGDFRKAEIEWVGLYEWLDEQSGKLNREDVVGFVRDNNVQMEDVLKGDPVDDQTGEERKQADIDFLNERGYAFELDMDGGYYLFDEGEPVEYDELPADVKEVVDRVSEDLNSDDPMGGGSGVYNDTKYGTYTLPGGMNYREMLITLPRHNDSPKINREDIEVKITRTYMDESVDYELYYNDELIRKGIGARMTDQEIRDLGHSILVDRNSDKGDYRNSHWNEPNVLAHVRFNTREGNMLFLEEIQSDWHQEGRKKGYRPDDYSEKGQELLDQKVKQQEVSVKIFGELRKFFNDVYPVPVNPAEMRDRRNLLIEITQAGHGLESAKEEYRRVFPADLERLSGEDFKSLYDIGVRYGESQRILTDVQNEFRELDKKAPNAPFKNTWHELVIKRMIRYAAENGYDKIGYAPGEVQNERYDLSKQVDRIEYNSGDNRLAAFKGNEKVIQETVEESNLEDYVGKEVAKRLLSDGFKWENQSGGNTYALEGDDLSVGGEGMKGFYDKILPRYLNKYLKKWDSKLGVEKLKISEPKENLPEFYFKNNDNVKFRVDSSVTIYMQGDNGQWYDLGVGGEYLEVTPEGDLSESTDTRKLDEMIGRVEFLNDVTLNRDEVQVSFDGVAHFGWGGFAKFLKEDASKDKTQDIWSFPITPDMMRSVLGEGQPMFKKEDTDPNSPDYRQNPIKRFISEIGGNPLQQRPHQYQKMWDGLLRSTQNMFVDGKRIQEGVVAEGGKISDKSNFVQDEENHYGRIENLRTEVENNFRKPIIEQMQELYQEKDVKYKDLRDYLYAMHAPERNADLYERNPERGESQSGMSDKEAADILRTFEQRGIKADLEDVAKSVYQWNKHTLRMQYISGMISKERFGGLWEKYDYYVPLRGFEELVDIDPTMYSFDRRMEGRESKAGDILSYVQAMSDTAIINGETNRVKQSFLEFVKENHERSDLFRIRNVYWRKTDEIDDQTGKQKWVATFTQPSPEDLLDGKVKRRLDPEKEQQLWEENSNIYEESTVKVQVDGRPVIVEVTKPHLARAFGKMDVEHMPKYLSATATMMNWLRNVITQYSPEFGMRNIIRDSWTGMINVAIDQNITQAAKVVNPVAYAGAFKALRNYYRKGEFDNSDWGKALKSYMKHGAVTGYWQLNQVKDHTKNLQKAIERGAFGKGRDGIKALGNFLDDYNRVLENIARVSAYKHLTQDKVTNPDTGKPYTNKQAANYARNLTVNFNRKGNSGGAIGTLYLFFNATVQGITRQVQPFFSEHTRIRNRAMAAPVVMGATAFMFAELLRVGLGKDDDEEWRYDKINDFTRKHNIILPNWFSDDPEDYLRVPLPYGYNVYWAAGDVANRFANGSTNVFDSAVEMAAATIDAYNPIGTSSGETIGEAAYKSLLPTIAKPGFELLTNTDFAGNKIKPEPFPFAVQDPKSQQHYQYVAGWAKTTAQWLNRVTGGDEFTEGTIDISPEHIEYMANFVGGGPARFIDGLAQTGNNVYDHVTGLEEVELYDIYDVPFVRSFYGKVSRSKTREQFLENRNRVEGLVDDLESYYASGQTEKARAFRQENDTMIGLFNDLKAIEKQQRLHNKMLDFYYNEKSEQDDAEVRDKIKNVVESQHELYLEFNRMVNEAKGKAGRKSPTQKVLEALK